MRQVWYGTLRTTCSELIAGDLDGNLLGDRLRHVLHLLDLLGDDVRLPHAGHLVGAAIDGRPVKAGPLINDLPRDRIDRGAAALPRQLVLPPTRLVGHLVLIAALIDELGLLRDYRLHHRVALGTVDGFDHRLLDRISTLPARPFP